jgi:Protein of unknown function (DUF1266).
MQNRYFEIEGIPRREGFRKQRSYIAVSDNAVFIELDGEKDHILLEDIFDIYIKEPIVEDVTSRTTVIEFYEEGDTNWYELEDETFPGLAEKMASLLQANWRHFEDKRKYPDTVKWFLACQAVLSIAGEQNPAIFGGAYRNPDTAAAQREVLFDSWGFNKKEDFMAMLPKLYEGRSMAQYEEDRKNKNSLDSDELALIEEIERRCANKGIWAWDLQRLIILCGLGYICDYISYEDSLDWCLKTGQKLQNIYSSWDDFFESYLLGYCYWSGDDLDDEDSEAHMRKGIYEFYKNRPDNPWNISWNHPLKKEW